MLDLSYPKVLQLFPEHLAPSRSESASFLIWYFENYLRLDALEAVDSVCDQSGDKGIDGIYLNSEANAIEVYQNKLFQKSNPVVGDRALREFQGTLSQLASIESIENLLATAGNSQVARLIERHDIKSHLAEFEVVGYFVCNGEIDSNGLDFLNAAQNIRFVGASDLKTAHISSTRNVPDAPPKSFDISGFQVAEYIVDSDHSAVIAPIAAKELVDLEGISNQEVFALNVRGPLGKTQVNRDISSSIVDSSKHKLFPLFHNGITIIAERVQRTNDDISIERYFVVNGCQSLSALFKNRAQLTDDLRILTKFIQAPPSSTLAGMITRFSNNQNGVKARDFKANNHIQIRLQNEMRSEYGECFFYEIKRGEDSNSLEAITNEMAGQYLMSFDLKTPWATHRKYQIFEDKHADLFGRPVVTAHRIVLCHVIATEVAEIQASISNPLFARYILTRYFILYIVRLILESDQTARDVIACPEKYVLDRATRDRFRATIKLLLAEVVTDLNAEIDQLGTDFDYRGKLRDEKWCKPLAHEIAATHKKLVDRDRLEPFVDIFTRIASK